MERFRLRLKLILVDEDLIHTHALRSGRIYLPLEALYLVRAFRPLILHHFAARFACMDES